MSLGNEGMSNFQFWKRQYETLCRKYDLLEAKYSASKLDIKPNDDLDTLLELQNLVINHRDNLINDLVKKIIKLKRENKNAESNDNTTRPNEGDSAVTGSGLDASPPY